MISALKATKPLVITKKPPKDLGLRGRHIGNYKLTQNERINSKNQQNHQYSASHEALDT